ncbi:hypothetical protein PoB_001723100 [Plakobranchus ocellatus]|uniref:Uncharacterized protein n=1 Tax=Plakobranchus ocellatus TaxID=259542 RepID=A0AAV3YUG7_9GAST|nr:hypothetical protein PoB_001723100 [Plakobranchus ocellatus]
MSVTWCISYSFYAPQISRDTYAQVVSLCISQSVPFLYFPMILLRSSYITLQLSSLWAPSCHFHIHTANNRTLKIDFGLTRVPNGACDIPLPLCRSAALPPVNFNLVCIDRDGSTDCSF